MKLRDQARFLDLGVQRLIEATLEISVIMRRDVITELRRVRRPPARFRDQGKSEITVIRWVITRLIIPDHGSGLITERCRGSGGGAAARGAGESGREGGVAARGDMGAVGVVARGDVGAVSGASLGGLVARR